MTQALVDGWARAATQQRDARWVTALLDAGLVPDDGLLGVLDPDEADRRLAAAVAAADLAALPGLVASCTAPWGRQASEAAITTTSRLISRLDLTNRPDVALTRAAQALQAALGPLAHRLHPHTDPAPLVEAVSRAPTPTFWLQSVAGAGTATGLAGVLAFRAALSTAFPGPTPTRGSSS